MSRRTSRRNTSLRRLAALGLALGLPAGLSALGTLSISLSFTGSALAAGDKGAQAEELFQKGLKLMADKKFAEACPLFAASQKLDPSIGTLGKLAECHEKEGKTASAWGEYREVAQLAKKDNDSKREKAANDRAALLEPKLMRLNIVVEGGATVTVTRDGEVVDAGTFGIALATDPGEHVIEAKAPGKTAWSTKVTLDKPGATVEVKVPALKDAEPTAVPSSSASAAPSSTATAAPSSTASSAPSGEPPVGPPPSTGSGMRVAGYTMAAVGLGGVIVGSVFGLTAKSKWDKGKVDCPNNQCKTDDAYTLTQDAKKFGNYSTIAFVVGGVALATGIVLVVVAPSAPKKDAPVTSLHLAPAVGATTYGVSLGGTF